MNANYNYRHSPRILPIQQMYLSSGADWQVVDAGGGKRDAEMPRDCDARADDDDNGEDDADDGEEQEVRREEVDKELPYLFPEIAPYFFEKPGCLCEKLATRPYVSV
ncbi:Hypothetical predicted protein [Octopus vulgaris]|uniref:Uncharacterized protein n=1 Tax=Octopus vulgaris TaxID=6645 RepID=A0AA36BQW6_OCTVU|nr:Hypothetical predicted protein [Octopus vulgaris]